MALIMEVGESDFVREFDEYNRSNNFSVEGRRALYNYLYDLSEDMGEDIKLDIIALCCEFNEYKNIKEFWNDYDKDDYPNLEELGEHTQVIPIENSEGFLIQAF